MPSNPVPSPSAEETNKPQADQPPLSETDADALLDTPDPAPADAAPAADAAVAPVTEAKPEEVKAAEEKSAEQPAAAVEAPVVPEWKSLDEVKLEAVPEASRPYVERVLGMAKAYRERRDAEVQAAVDSVAATRAQFEQLIGKLEGDDGKAVKELFEATQAAAAEIQDYAVEVVGVSWLAFEARNPWYAKLTEPQRSGFAELIGSPQFRQRFEGKNEVERLEDAARFYCYRSGIDVKALTTPAVAAAPGAPAAPVVVETKPVVVETKPVEKPAIPPERARQALVADTGSAHGVPVRGIDDMGWDEIRDRHDNLLD